LFQDQSKAILTKISCLLRLLSFCPKKRRWRRRRHRRQNVVRHRRPMRNSEVRGRGLRPRGKSGLRNEFKAWWGCFKTFY